MLRRDQGIIICSFLVYPRCHGVHRFVGSGGCGWVSESDVLSCRRESDPLVGFAAALYRGGRNRRAVSSSPIHGCACAKITVCHSAMIVLHQMPLWKPPGILLYQLKIAIRVLDYSSLLVGAPRVPMRYNSITAIL